MNSKKIGVALVVAGLLSGTAQAATMANYVFEGNLADSSGNNAAAVVSGSGNSFSSNVPSGVTGDKSQVETPRRRGKTRTWAGQGFHYPGEPAYSFNPLVSRRLGVSITAFSRTISAPASGSGGCS